MDSREESVVRIHSEKQFFGSGFLVHRANDACFVMTCLHVVKKFLKTKRSLRIFFPNGDLFDDVSIVKVEESVDLALLRYPATTNSVSPRSLQLSPLGAPYVGPVDLIAYFVENANTITIRPGTATGLIIGEPTVPGTADCTSPCNISNQVSQGGASGGPLMAGEEVIGVHTAGAAGIKFSIMAKDIYATLQKWSKATQEGIEIREMLTMIAAETATASSSKQ